MTGAGGQIPSQEQLEALYKQLPSNSEQLDSMQKQMLAIMEQQQKIAALTMPGLVGATPTLATPTLATPTQANPSGVATGTTTTAPSVSPGGAEMFQLPLLFLGVPPGIAPYAAFPPSSSTSSNSSATASPTSTTSNDPGISGPSLTQFPLAAGLSLQPSGLSAATREPLSLGGSSGGGIQQRRPLSESLSAPGFQSMSDPSYEVMQKQFQLQQQQLLGASHQIHQHFLDQQQRSGCKTTAEVLKFV